MQFDFCRKIFVNVEEITVEAIQTYDEVGFSQRTLSIRTTAGKMYDLILQAEKPEQLEFRDPPDPNAWLTPKLYTGSVPDEKDA